MAYIEEIFRILCYILYVHIFGSRLAEIIAMPVTCVQRFAYGFSDSAPRRHPYYSVVCCAVVCAHLAFSPVKFRS